MSLFGVKRNPGNPAVFLCPRIDADKPLPDTELRRFAIAISGNAGIVLTKAGGAETQLFQSFTAVSSPKQLGTDP
jgi:hypothetical protein